MRLHEREGRGRSSSRSRRTRTAIRSRSRSTRATTRTGSPSPTGSRTTRATSTPAPTRSPRTFRRAGISSRPSARTRATLARSHSRPARRLRASSPTRRTRRSSSRSRRIRTPISGVPLQRQLRRGRLLPRRRAAERLGRSRPGHVLGLRERARGLGLSPRRSAPTRRTWLDRARSRRDGDVRLHEHEARHDHRREADEPERCSWQFGFSGDAAGTIGDNGQIVVANLVPGHVHLDEAAAEGWSLTSISCNDANSTGASAAGQRRSGSRQARS